MTIPAHIQKAIQAYYAERATPGDIAALEDWFRADEAHIKIFAEHGMVEWQILCEQEKADAAAILTMLREAEQNAEAEVVILDLDASPIVLGGKEKDPNQLSAHDYAAAGRYALRLALTSKPAKRIYAYVGVAAAVLLAIVLFNPFASDAPDTIADLDPWDDIDTTTPPAVATLTATHNAQWADTPAEGASAPGSLTPGSKLHPNQRLTLTAGFAEITTNDGAIVILEAPATIELLDSNNSIRLHIGKLVGICETESSKGFVVRTPHVDITDLGTRFGVAIGSDGSVLTKVFDGKVLSTSTRIGAEAFIPRELSSGQAMALDAQGSETIVDQQTEIRLAALQITANNFQASKKGITSISGNLRWSEQSPQQLDPKQMPTGPDALIRSELWDHRLQRAIAVGIHQTGIDETFDLNTTSPATIDPGTVIRSYVITVKPEESDPLRAVLGQATFDGEILGVIAFESQWTAFKQSVSDAASPIFTFFDKPFHVALRENDLPAGDAITISEDRRTLGFRLSTREAHGLDHLEYLRVIVRSPLGDTP